MHPRGPGRERHVHPIVHEDRYADRAPEDPRDLAQLAWRGPLEPKLHRGHAAAHRRLGQCDDVPLADERIVGDEHQAQEGR